MKKFTSLFALLSCLCVVSAQAENNYVYPTVTENEVCIFYESDNTDFNYIYVYDANGTVLSASWPGDHIDLSNPYLRTAENLAVYKWSYTGDKTPANIIFTKRNESNPTPDASEYRRSEQQYINHGYYYQGEYNHTVDQGYNIYFDKSGTNWGDPVRVYVWHNTNNSTYRWGWNGNQMYKMDNGLYMFHINSTEFGKLLFTDGSDNNKTGNFEAVDGKLYTKDGALVLSDNSDFPSALSGYMADVNYTRATNGEYIWNTLCLPFAINTENVDNVTFYQLSSASSSQVTFSPISGEISGGTPVVYKQTAPGELVITANNVTLTNTISDQSPISNWTLKGTFENKSDVDNIYFIYENQFCNGDDITIRPYRAWFESTVGLGNAPIRIEVADTEGLQFVEKEDGTVKAYYDLQGRKLDSARKGLVIENGKIIMIK